MLRASGLTRDDARGRRCAAAGLVGTALAGTSAAKAWATTSGTAAGSRPFSLRLYFTAMAASISCTTATKVSMTPSPRGRHRREGLAAPEVQGPVHLGLGLEVRQVLLVVLEDEGNLLGNQAVREQVDLHVLEGGQVFLERWTSGESATKTTASAPARTTRRVALYWTWPGTV